MIASAVMREVRDLSGSVNAVDVYTAYDGGHDTMTRITDADLAQANRGEGRGPALSRFRQALNRLRTVTQQEHIAMLTRERNHWRMQS